MFDSFKNTLNNTLQSVTKQLVPPPKDSQFLEKGTLTPAEYVQAGDKLISLCGSWKWFPAVEAKFESQYLPKDKQFIGIENIISKQRIKELLNTGELFVSDGTDDDIMISKPIQPKEEESKDIKKVEQAEDLRFYNLYVVYDLYYFTPRLFLGGKDENGQPLTYDMIKEDIMSEYADKTVTYEHHPHLNVYLATIHPCKHADTLKFITQQMIENGAEKSKIHADNAILIFLKFMGSVIPTIQFDFVSEIVIG